MQITDQFEIVPVAEITPDELERELTGEMIALEKQLAVVDAEMAKLSENQEKVLRLRYCEGLSWKKTADETKYSIRQAIRIAEKMNASAVKLFTKLDGCD